MDSYSKYRWLFFIHHFTKTYLVLLFLLHSKLKKCIFDQKKMNWKTTITFCKYLENGWRLPNKDELNSLYINKDKIGGFAYICYWSSTEYDDSSAWLQAFSNSNGFQGTFGKSGRCNVRAVRAF